MTRYLLRFDDISPYMNWEVWDEIEMLLDSLDIKPLVAIVPDCKDSNIMISSKNDSFWDRVLEWQSKGWSIAMHGYDHVLTYNNAKNIVNLSKFTEFSGLSYKEQASKISSGLKIFNSNKINIKTWVAPAHSFDHTTLKVLKDYNFSIISDGLFVSPFTDKEGIFWIPQQLWKLRQMPYGIWTVCYHHNKWKVEDFKRFRKDVIKFKANITSVDKIYNDFQYKKSNILIRVQSILFNLLLAIKKILRYAK